MRWTAFFAGVVTLVMLPVASRAAIERDPFQAPCLSGTNEAAISERLFLAGIVAVVGRRLAIVRSEDGIGSVVEVGTTLLDVQLVVTAIEHDSVRLQDPRTDVAYVLRLRDDAMEEEVLP